MKTNLFLSSMLAGAFCLFSACDDDDKSGYLPDDGTIKALSDKYPDARNVSWETKGDYAVADFITGSQEAEAWFDAQGNWMMTETDIPYEALPAPVKTAFQQKYKGWKVDDVDKLERSDAGTVYVIEAEQGETDVDLYYTAEGQLIKEVMDDDNAGTHEPFQIPEAIKSKIAELYPDAVILEYDVDKQTIEVDILHNQAAKEVVFDATYNWLYTEWDTPLSAVPEAVQTALKNSSYGTYHIDDIDVIEKADGLFYVFELEKGNEEVTVTYTAEGVAV